MDLLTIDTLKELIQKQENPCISIYLPTFRKGAEVEQNSIRFKNIIRETEKLLTEKKFRTSEIEELLRPARALINDTNFWNYQSDGLAVFVTRGEFRYYKLPYFFEETIIVNTRFYIKPLLQIISKNERYFVLALDKKHLKLYEGTRYSLKEVELKNAPVNLQETLQIDESEQQNFHTVERGANNPAIYNGPGYGTDDAREIKELKRFFQIVNEGIFDTIKHGNPPLILAGVEYLQPIYREANSYSNLLENGVTLNTDQLKEDDLHSLSWSAAESYFKKSFDEAQFTFEQLYGTERTSNYLVDILKAAFSNKIESLFVNINEKVWGKFDMTTYDVKIHSNPDTGNEDLCDLTAVQTLLHNGAVYVVNNETMPHAKPLAAVFRY